MVAGKKAINGRGARKKGGGDIPVNKRILRSREEATVVRGKELENRKGNGVLLGGGWGCCGVILCG